MCERMLGEPSNLLLLIVLGADWPHRQTWCAQLPRESGLAFLLSVGALPWLQATWAGLQSADDQMTLVQQAGTV